MPGFAERSEIKNTPRLGGDWLPSQQGELGQKESISGASLPAHPPSLIKWSSQPQALSGRGCVEQEKKSLQQVQQQRPGILLLWDLVEGALTAARPPAAGRGAVEAD